MAGLDKVTVDKAYFDALLRRADFHTSTQLYGQADPLNVTISRDEYDSLLRTSREYDLLKNALFQGGITAETLDLLISGANTNAQRKDSGSLPNAWADDFPDQTLQRDRVAQRGAMGPYSDSIWKRNGGAPNFNLAPGSGPFHSGNPQQANSYLRVPGPSRQVSLGAPPSSVPDDAGSDDQLSLADEGIPFNNEHAGLCQGHERRTLYFSGFSDRTTYRDLLSVIKGGKILSINLRSERSATVTFLDGAADFLAWAKRNDIYLHSKRIEIKWADRQYRLNGHISNKIMNGATRNILVRNAISNGLSDEQIRADMEHIHNLTIIDVNIRNGDAYVSTNAIHNALFARTCMMSRTTYKGCKVEFFRDECDVPLPAPTIRSRTVPSAPVNKKKTALVNRFNLLDMDGENSSDEENRMPADGSSDDEDDTINFSSHAGVSLNFLDSADP